MSASPTSLDSTPAGTSSSTQLGRSIRSRFPLFAHAGSDLAYLDTAASSQKPSVVIDRLSRYLGVEHANIHRGAYDLSAHATDLYDQARSKLAGFIGAKSPSEVVFVRGATEGINLLAQGMRRQIKKTDTILITLLEHHSNIVPWQMLATQTGAKVVFADVYADGTLNMSDFEAKLVEFKPKIVGVTSISNALGTKVKLEEIIPEAHRFGAVVLVDGAQGVGHGGLDVTALDIDFLVASAHKLYGPTGIGFLYGKAHLLEAPDPYQGGGDMIAEVTTSGSTWAEVPRRFEAGTPAIGEAIAFGEAIDFMLDIGLSNIIRHEDDVLQYGIELLRAESGVTIVGPASKGGSQASIVSFTVAGVHPHDLSTVLDSSHGVQIRGGNHCAMPLLNRLGLHATARASVGMYSCREDFDRLIEGVRHAIKLFT